MNLFLLPVAATLAVALDAFTTWRGVFVKKVATEGNLAPIAQWFAKSPTHLMLAPLVPASLFLFFLAGSWASAVAAGIGAGIAVKSGIAAVHNIRINKGF